MINPKVPGKVTCKGRPNPVISQGFTDWMADTQAERRWNPHGQNLQFYIIALANDELSLTPIRMLARNGYCDICGAHCPKKTTPVFQYKKNCSYYPATKQPFFCETCLSELRQNTAELNTACQVYKGAESDPEAVEDLRRNLSATVTGELPAKLQEHLDELYIARNVQSVTS